MRRLPPGAVVVAGAGVEARGACGWVAVAMSAIRAKESDERRI
jgi:hypothetical protein